MDIEQNRQPSYVIAEIGVNHNGDLELAKKMIVAAKESGADAVKFQTFTAETLVSFETPKVQYQKNTTDPNETHYEMIRKLELPREDHFTIFEFCKSMRIEFISTPYDIDSAQFLDEIGVNIFKTASADIVDLPLQEFLAKTGKKVIVSTGMATLGEIDNVVKIYRRSGNSNISLLHCVSNYPCSMASLNLRVIQTLSSSFQLPVGYSDHSEGAQATIIAVSLGAKIIEKHFTLDKNLVGPDHKASSTPEEFTELVEAIRMTEVALGDPFKECQDEERQMAQVSRKSIVLNQDVQEGDLLTQDHITMKRPGTGLLAHFIPSVLNKIVNKSLKQNHLLQWNDLQ